MTYEIPDSDGLSTVEKVIYLRKQYPDALAADIARSIGVSRERVRQILEKFGLEANVRPRLKAERSKDLVCFRPGCENLRKVARSGYCSQKCYNLVKYPPYYIPCTNCGTISKVSQFRYDVMILRGYKNLFCNRACFRDWRIGKTLKIIRNTRSLPERIKD